MEWTRPGIRRHFDFQGKDEGGRKRYMITLQLTNKDPGQNLAAIHVPCQQDGWSMEVPRDFCRKTMVTGLKVEKGGESWICRVNLKYSEGEIEFSNGEREDIFFLSGGGKEGWEAYLEPGRAATIMFEAFVTCGEPLMKQTLTLRYFPDLGWRSAQRAVLKPSPFYSSNLEVEKGYLA